jgi:hypothetical protein
LSWLLRGDEGIQFLLLELRTGQQASWAHCTGRRTQSLLLLLQVSTMAGDLLVLAAGQARQMGRMLNVCPDALLDDGLLDFTVLFGSPGKQVCFVVHAKWQL